MSLTLVVIETSYHDWNMLKTKLLFIILLLGFTTGLSFAQARRKVIINEDCSGPGGSNMQTLALLIQSPQVEVLGITVVSGDAPSASFIRLRTRALYPFNAPSTRRRRNEARNQSFS